jgi:hypothetical protein
MSLRSIHILFITASTLLALGFGIWCMGTHDGSASGSHQALGLGSFAVAVALMVYGAWFLKKIKSAGRS